MIDEVQSGNGRTGQFFSYQHADILPDGHNCKRLGQWGLLAFAWLRGKAAHVLGPGNHGSTFGGNPLLRSSACSARCLRA